MAGAGYKLFNTGDVLTAQQVNEYLMQQTVMVFADASARTTALSGVLAEGMLSYLKDTDATQYYTGSTWVGVGSDLPSQTGNSGKYLTTDGTSASWATVSSGGITLLSTTSLSGATTTISAISGSYTNLFGIIYGVTNATSTGTFRFAPNGTTNISSQTVNQSETTLSGRADTYFELTGTGSGNGSLLTDSANVWQFNIFNYASTTTRKPTSFNGTYIDGGSARRSIFGFGGINTTSAITSLVFSNASGNLSTGTVLLYGVK